jgi:hypothetical protein
LNNAGADRFWGGAAWVEHDSNLAAAMVRRASANTLKPAERLLDPLLAACASHAGDLKNELLDQNSTSGRLVYPRALGGMYNLDLRTMSRV